jgi:alpha-tubulin suppressor-like RCC1 family protein
MVVWWLLAGLWLLSGDLAEAQGVQIPWTWGNNSYGQLGQGYFGSSPDPLQVKRLTGVVAVAGGGSHSLAVKSDGTLWAWGDNNYGQLGIGTTTERHTPVPVVGLTGVVAVAGGGSHSLTVKSDGTLWAWGDNQYGELGDGTNTNRDRPIQVTGLTGVVAVAGSWYYSLALKSDGTLWAWGNNQYGQLGIGTSDTSPHPAPVQVGLTSVTAIAAGSSHSLAVKQDGTVWAWGSNFNGELGDGTTNSSSAPVEVKSPDGSGLLTGVVAVAAGNNHSLAVKQDGTVWAWGDNYYGELGTSTGNGTTPAQVAGPNGQGVLTGITAVAAGADHSLAVKQDGTVWAWGYNWACQLGDGTPGIYGAPGSYTPVEVVGTDGQGFLTDVRAVAAGGFHSLAVKSDGAVWAWGSNDAGALGQGYAAISNVPLSVSSLPDTTAIAAGGDYSLALKKDGTVWAWGYNYFGQLGNGTTGLNYGPGATTPVQVLGPDGQGFLTDVQAVAAGLYQSLALKSDGTVWAWGGLQTTPAPVAGLTGVTAIAAGLYHSLAVKQDGTVWAWGRNYEGQLGNGTQGGSSSTPVQVLGPNGQGFLTDVAAVAGGGYHSLALKKDGTVWAWGNDGFGQLGTSTGNGTTPAQVVGPDGQGFLTDVQAVAAGEGHSLALRSDGTVWAWGANTNGQLGDGASDFSVYSTPAQVLGPNGQGFLTDVQAVAAGGRHSLALKSDGTVWTWGANATGQLGDGTTIDPSQPPYGQTTPVQVVGLTGVTAVAGGSDGSGVDHSLALAPATTLSGTLTLEGLVPYADIQTINFAFRPTGGSADFSLPALVLPDGLFTLGGLPEKAYTLHIKGSKYLATDVAVDLSGGSISGVTAILLPGDINNDNAVNITDLELLADAFNATPASPTWNANADLDGNGKVDIFDLGLLADSYGKQGDP